MSDKPDKSKTPPKPKTPRERLEAEAAKKIKDDAIATMKLLDEVEFLKFFGLVQYGRLDFDAIVDHLLRPEQGDGSGTSALPRPTPPARDVSAAAPTETSDAELSTVSG